VSDPADPAATPPLDAILAVDPAVLAGALRAIPDGENVLLRLADGNRSVKDLIAGSGLEPVRALAALGRLLDVGVLRVVPPGTAAAQPAPHGPEGVDWFAEPASASPVEPEPDAPEPPAEPLEPGGAAPPAVAPASARRPRTTAFVVGGAVLLATLLLGGAWSARRQREQPAGSPPGSPPVRVERSAAEPSPPALSVTEPVPSEAYREAMAEAGARHQAGDLAGAAAACRRATTIDPSIGAGWMALGEVELAAGNRDGARAAFERYLAAEPGGRHAARIRALLERLRP